MNAWRVILQVESPSGGFWSPCIRFDMSGVVVPAHISIIACDPAAISKALAVHAEIHQRLTRIGGASSVDCPGPRGLECQAWDERSCQHVLVLIIGSPNLHHQFETMAVDWNRKSHGGASVLVALVPPLDHAGVFGTGRHPELAKCTASAWKGDVEHLASTALELALLDEKPGVFISYVRNDARVAADDIHDALLRAGYRVFLDRFSGTPGRVFPHELAEAMADHGLVLLLETPGVFHSEWTTWELAFAHRYRLGPVAVNFRNAPRWRAATNRLSASEDPTANLPAPLLEQVVNFVRHNHLTTSVTRRAYFETLVQLAAQTKRGSASVIDGGLLELTNASSVKVGSALPGAVPGRLRHVKRLVDSPIPGQRLLAGQHEHLRPRDRDDLRWLAGTTGITLAGPASIYSAVRRIL